MGIQELEAERAKLVNEARDVQRAGMRAGTLEANGESVRCTAAHPNNGHYSRLTRIDSSIRATDDAIAQARVQLDRDERRARVAQAAGIPGATINGDESSDEYWNRLNGTGSAGRDGRDRSDSMRMAHAAIERRSRDGVLSTEAASRISDVLDADRNGLDAAYVASVSSGLYEEAFAELLRNPTMAHFSMTTGQADAMREALGAHQRRASFGTGFQAGPIGESTNSIPLPITADLTLVNTAPGITSPLRQFADVKTITTQQYVAGISAGMSAHWYPEFGEVTDDSPAISDSPIVPQTAAAYAQWSVEVDADWADVRTNLMAMAADAKARLEADAFLTGPGETSNQPLGLLSGSTANIITSATATAIGVADLLTVQDSLDSRYSATARWYSTLALRNQVDQLVAPGSTTVAPVTDQAGNILRRGWSEVSNMAVAGAGNKVMIYGDLKQGFRIVDRLGMQAELVPLVLGTNRCPTGTRGLFCYWRVSSAPINENAYKVLKQHT